MPSKLFFPVSFVLLIIFYGVGVWGMVWSKNPDEFAKLTPLNLLITAALLLSNHQLWTKKLVFILAIIGIAGFVTEAIGVNTGIIFGEYAYGNTLGVKLFNTPLIIGLNWVILSYSTVVIVRTVFRVSSNLLAALLSAGLMVALDIVIEPVAILTDMWSWSSVEVPLKNYMAWLVIAFVFNFVLTRFITNSTVNKMALPVYSVQFLFFSIILFLS
jgi:bisanhydrobacterioruberin hydratase